MTNIIELEMLKLDGITDKIDEPLVINVDSDFSEDDTDSISDDFN